MKRTGPSITACHVRPFNMAAEGGFLGSGLDVFKTVAEGTMRKTVIVH